MRSIRSIIFLRLFWIVLIFFSVVSGVAYYLTNEAITHFAIKDATTSLNFVINNIRVNYSHELQYLDTLANVDGFSPFRKESAQDMSARFLLYENLFSTMHMYSATGDLIFAEKRPSIPRYAIEPNFYKKPDPGFIALAKRVLAEKHPAASETFYTSSNDLYQTYITPVFTDSTHTSVFGLLSGGVFPRRQKLDHLLAGLKLGQDNFIFITDSKGRLMAIDGISEAELQSSLKAHLNQAVHDFYENKQPAGQPLIYFKTKVGASHFIVMSLPIPELKLVVTVGSSTALIDQKQVELSHRLLVALIAGLLLSLFASIFAGERLSRPFREMVDTVSKINSGNFAARVQYDKDDEIGALSRLINTLAEKIDKAEYLGNLWSTETSNLPGEAPPANEPDNKGPTQTPEPSSEHEKEEPSHLARK